MAKEKSLKLRTIASMYALYKHSDKNHRLTPKKLNTFLKPFGLSITGVGLADDVRVMQEFGLDAHTNEGTQIHSAYIGEHLLTEDTLKKLVFAVSTNPHLSKSQATEILRQFKPLATIYQEPLLQSFVYQAEKQQPDDSLYWAYSVVKEAIENNRRILYTIDYAKYDRNTQTIGVHREWETMFTPKFLLKSRETIYALGYNDTDEAPAYLDLSNVATIRLSMEYKTKKDLVTKHKEQVPIQGHLLKKAPLTLYEGPAIFRCGASNIPALYNLFGEPTAPVRQTRNHVITYEVSNAQITVETLTKLAVLAQKSNLQILGPDQLTAVVTSYYDTLSNTLLCKHFLRRR